MAVADATVGKFEIGRVATRTFEVIRGNFVSFFVLGLIATLPTTAYTVILTPNFVTRLGATPQTLIVVSAIGSAFVGLVFAVILQATLTYGTISFLSKQPVTLGRALGIGMREFLPLIAIAILEGLGIGAGFILLIVPGMMLYVMWAVVVPVRVAEQKGIFESFGRSRELTAGYRWPIFGTLIIYFLGAGIAQATVRPMIAIVSVNGSSVAMLYAATAISALISAIVAVASATLVACIYYELRMIKEGVGPEQIAAVFE